MHYLDDIQHLLEVDRSSMHKAIKDLPLQLEQAWQEALQIPIPDTYREMLNVVICGMGGSGLGAHAITSLYSQKLSRPVEIVSSYSLPGYIGEKTIVIISSNSGNTEEEIACFHEAKERGCMILGLTSGGQLQKLFEDNGTPVYIFDQRHNTSGQPRMSTGYMMLSILAFFVSLGIVHLDNNNDITQSIEEMGEAGRLNGLEIEFNRNPAKMLAHDLHYAIPFLIGAEFLGGSIHTMANQINENSKKLSAYFLLSEMNHHLLEGMGFEQNKGAVSFVIFDSELYAKRIRQRIELTKTIIEKNNIRVYYHLVKGDTPIAQVFNLLQFGSYVSYYMGMLNDVDPSPIPWVNFLKKELHDFDTHSHE